MKRIIKITALLAGVFTLLFGSAFLFLYFNKAKVIQLFTQEINKTLEARMDVRNIDLSLKKFPLVSIALDEVSCYEPLPNSMDTLFYFKQIHFQFGLWDLLRGKYDLQKIDFDRGQLQVRTLANGKYNFIIWKEQPELTNSDFELDLQKVVFNHTNFQYQINEQTRLSSSLELLELSGHFDSENSLLTIKGTGSLDALSHEETAYLTQALPVQFELQSKSDAIATQLQQGKVILNESVFSVSGYVNDKQQHWEVRTKDATPGALLAVLPETVIGQGNLPQVKGKLNAFVQIDQTGTAAPTITADFSLANGEVKLPQWTAPFEAIAAEGRYFSDGKVDKFQFTTIAFSFDKFQATASGAITDFNRPKITIRMAANGPAENAHALMGIVPDAEVSGNIILETEFSNTYSSWELMQQNTFKNAETTGKLEWRDGAFSSEEMKLLAKNITAQLRLSKNAILVDQLSLTTRDSDLQFTGNIAGGLTAFMDKQIAWQINGNLKSNRLNIQEWLLVTFPAPSSDSSPTKNNRMAIDFNVQNVSYEKFHGTQLSGTFIYNNKGIEGRSVQCNALNGKILSNFLLEDQAEKHRFTNQSTLTHIDIHQLFGSFDNFGQDALTLDNIYGVGDCNLRFVLDFDQNWEAEVNSLLLQSDLKIKEGRLVNFAPLESLSKFVDVNELKDVRFSTLSNTISIQDRIITIPEMTITSSAIELGLAGTHSFDNYVDYSVRLKQRDLLGSKKRTKRIDDWIEEADRPGESFLWVRIKGDFDNLDIGLDREKNNAALRKGWGQQGIELKDTTKQTREKRQGGELIFEWQE